MNQDSRLIAEKYFETQEKTKTPTKNAQTCPKCRKGKMCFNTKDVKYCDNCGFKPSNINKQDPIKEEQEEQRRGLIPSMTKTPRGGELGGQGEPSKPNDITIKKLAHKIMIALDQLSWPEAVMIAGAIDCAQASEEFKKSYGTFGIRVLNDAIHTILG
jgi:hypothetical protein